MDKLENELLTHLTNVPVAELNLSALFQEFVVSKSSKRFNATIVNDYLDDLSDNKWQLVDRILSTSKAVALGANGIDFSKEDIGTFWVKIALNSYETDIHDSFTIKGEGVSLPDFVAIYNTKTQIPSNLTTPAMYKEVTEKVCAYSWDCFVSTKIKRVSEFEECFKTVKVQALDFVEQDDWISLVNQKELSHILPCSNTTEYPACAEYCSWHKEFFAKASRQELLTRLKYAQPQGSVVTESSVELGRFQNLPISIF